MSEEVINKINNLIEKYKNKIGTSGALRYNRDLDSICCDLLDLKNELEKYVIKGDRKWRYQVKNII